MKYSLSRSRAPVRRLPLSSICLLVVVGHLTSQAQVTFTRVADATTRPPDTTTPFVGFFIPKVHRGWVVFEGWVRGAAGNDHGLYGWRSGTLTTLVDSRTTHPEAGVPFWNNFRISGEDSFAIEDGVLVFAHQQPLNQAGIFQWSNGILSTLVWTNDRFVPTGAYVGGAVAGRSGGTNLIATRFGDPRSGLVLIPGDGSAIAHNYSDDLLGLPSGFKSLGSAALDRGRIAFSAGAGGRSVLYSWTASGVRILAETGTTVPGWTSPIAEIGRIVVDDDTVVFAGRAADSTTGLLRVRMDASGLTRLLDTTVTLPGGRALQVPQLETWSFGASGGTVVFEAGDPFSDHGIYAWRGGALFVVVETGGDLPEGQRVGEVDLSMGCLSDGTVAFTVRKLDGTRAIYLAHLPGSPTHGDGGSLFGTLAPDLLAAPFSLRAWLEQSPEGRRWIALYDRHAGELLRLAMADANLRSQTLEVLTSFLPALDEYLSGSGGTVTVSAAQVGLVRDVGDGYVAQGSAWLAADLNAERSRFHDLDDFVGKTFAEWGSLLGIGSPATPFVTLSEPVWTNNVFQARANRVPGLTYRLQRTAVFRPPIWTDVPNADVELRESRAEVRDPAASAGEHLYRLLLGE